MNDEDYQKKQDKLFGNHALMVTPMQPDGSLDEDSTRSLVDFLIDKGVHGILTLGSTGEVFAMTDDERKRLAEVVIDHAAGRVPVGVGVAHSSAEASATLAKHAENAGGDYIFTTGPYYHPHSAEGVFRHVKFVGDSTELPLMVYDGGAGIEFSLPLLRRMADNIPTLFASKLFLPYPAKIAQYGEATNGRVQAWAGHDQLNYLMLQYGAKGMTSAASCVVPAEQSFIFEAIRDGNLEEARKSFHDTVGPLNSIAFANVLQYPQCYKRALKWMGVIEHDATKVVMEPIDDVRSRELRAVLERIGVLTAS
ncbi:MULTISPECIES: dihydrodipicolinate synthase family protein [unclassified Cryobacterium]|uniref:dihydrodipicolinate synthase family protein n=1 Tax=unclassified Cryobacterium TaxID=2649013 RepID=UPI00106CDAF1|nr:MULTISPECIES: dihydrodipicolinate synthase family protein [unclassified Cryobacterium]TFD07587.1 dihydrodipicolinate synthase family protein [Cryobacterium sp. TMT1-66-1]TFD14466.1 dihydrodipicolinate synthase family protein [Cryobacterium sp. TMT1-2-2]